MIEIKDFELSEEGIEIDIYNLNHCGKKYYIIMALKSVWSNII